MPSIVIGTRGSQLALAQANWVVEQLKRLNPGLEAAIRVIDSRPKLVPGRPLEGDGIFVKEIQAALVAGDIDAGVHSLKDMPTARVDGLTVGAIPVREDPREALVGSTLEGLPYGAAVGTSSPRRSAQLKSLRPDLAVLPLTGNLPTRIDKVRRGDYRAAMLAAAGLARLGLAADELLPLTLVLPAPGQGALAIEIRSGEPEIAALVAKLHDGQTAACVTAERGVLKALGGGCLLPVSALGTFEDGRLHLQGCVISADGSAALRAEAWGTAAEVEDMAVGVAEDLSAQGARELLGQPA